MKKIRNNKLTAAVATAYLLLFLFMPEMAKKAIGNSTYYLIEMLEVLPVIFLLTVVIDVLVPRETILRYLGEKSGIKGNFLALLLGSISAGPIYAAFPISKMLLGKGASLTNIVIILNAWAVIKLPMLANEAKFLGVRFMAVRWVLTVIAIIVMGYATNRVVKRAELTDPQERRVLLEDEN